MSWSAALAALSLPQRSNTGRQWALDRVISLPLLCLAIAVAIGLLWITAVPFHRGPDEAAHFQVARFIRDQGRLPVFRPDELWLIHTPMGVVETYATFPPLAYLLAALVMVPMASDAFVAARGVSFLSYLGTVGVTYALARRLLRDDPRALTAAAVVALLPQFSFTAAYFNNDALAVFLTGLVLLLLVQAWQAPAWFVSWALGAALGALLLTKYTFYPAAAVLFAAALGIYWHKSRCWHQVLGLAVGILGVAGWWFARNWQLYGEIVPTQVLIAAKSAAGGNSLTVPATLGLTVWDMAVSGDFWEVTLKSFVGVFGLLTIYMEPWLYWACAAAFGIALGGSALELRRRGMPAEVRALATVGTALTAATVLSVLFVSTYGEYTPQGRYLFALLVPLGVLVAFGWHGLARTSRQLKWLPMAGLVAAGMFNVVSLLGYLVPQEFGPSASTVVVQLDRPGPSVPSDQPIEVLGWSFVRGGGHWRPWLLDAIITYRRPVPAVNVYLDGPPEQGQHLGEADYGLPRPDVGEMYGGVIGLEPVGFRFVLRHATLSKGSHRIYACSSLRRDDPRQTCGNRSFEVV